MACSELGAALQESLTNEMDLNMAGTVICKKCEAILTRGVPVDNWPGLYTEAEMDNIRSVGVQKPSNPRRAGRKRESLLSPTMKKKYVLKNRPELRELKNDLEKFALEHQYDLQEVEVFLLWHSLYSSGERKRAKAFLGE